MSGLMQGKRGLIMGITNQKSIAWAIAEAVHKEGAELAFSYPHEKVERRVTPLAESLNSSIVLECNVNSDKSIETMFAKLSEKWGKIDFIVHSIAFSDKDELKGRYVNTTRANFQQTMDISCFSLAAVAKAAEKYMNNNGSIITLSYYGAEKVIPNYNVMGVAKAALEASVRYLAADMGPEKGIRVNSISAGPIKTLAASAIDGFGKMLEDNASAAPLRKNVSAEDVGKTALWLLSDLGSGVTGENVYVDNGANIMGIGVN